MLCVVLTRKMRYSSIYFITRKYKTDMPFCTIRPAGLGGQIEHQTRLGQFSQFGRAQHSSGNGVDHQIERGEVAGQEAGVERAVPGGFDAGKIARRACGYCDMRAERGQFDGEQAADPAVADDERPRALNGDRQFLHGELKRTLGGGDGVSGIGALIFCGRHRDGRIWKMPEKFGNMPCSDVLMFHREFLHKIRRTQGETHTGVSEGGGVYKMKSRPTYR